MALVNFKKGLLTSLPSNYVEGTFYVTTDERAIYLDVTNDKRIRLGDFQEFANLAALEANEKPSTTALYYITDGNILAKWDGAKYVQINVQKIVEKSATNGNITFDGKEIKVYDDTALAGRVTTAEGKITALETESAKHALKTEVEAALADKADKSYVGTFTHDTAKTIVEYVNAKTDGIATSGNLEALGQRVGAIEADYLTSDDKTELEGKIDLKLDAADVTGDLLTHNASEFAAASHSHAISDVTGLQDALDGKQAVGDYATKTEAQGYADAKDSAIAAAKKAGDDAASALATYKGEMTTALNGKQDVIPANTYDSYGAAAQALADAKAYADTNDADTKYGITYDSANKKIKLVEGGSEVEIDASAFIKDGMINTVTIDGNDDLIITFNTDAGKENIVLPLDQLVDIYTGVEGDRVKVTVSSDNKISADLVAGSISKNYLDTSVQESLSKADSALQAHQDISHLATEADLTLAENRITALEAIDHEHANKALLDTYTQTEADLADAVAKKHEHANKTVLDGITAEKVAAWDAAEQNAEDYADGLNTAMDTRVKVLEEIDHDAYKAYADQAEADAKSYTDAALTWGTF